MTDVATFIPDPSSVNVYESETLVKATPLIPKEELDARCVATVRARNAEDAAAQILALLGLPQMAFGRSA
ncbi:hypothetical protein [Gryllotalpicola koreensis]|uniref:hypothetical protein n=1 Tax=Gryllotalpicola koreensis TaxID=993086 RepID=UPI0031E141BC